MLFLFIDLCEPKHSKVPLWFATRTIPSCLFGAYPIPLSLPLGCERICYHDAREAIGRWEEIILIILSQNL
jgi:hypothetical protein